MKSESAVYRLSSSPDPRFNCLTYRAAESLLGNESPIEDWGPEFASDGRWLPRPLAKVWTPQPVGGNVAGFVDYPTLELTIPAFSPRAVEALRPHLEDAGELLEVRHKNGPYFALNVTAISDAMMIRKSDIKWFPNLRNVRANDITRFEFTKSKLGGLSLFKLKQTPRFKLVSEEFKRRVEAACLNGFNFTKVWPLPPGVYWRDAQIEARRRGKTKLNLQGQSLILRFRPKKNRPSSQEEKQIKHYVDELTELLTNQQSLADPYNGSVETYELVDGDCRIFLSSPDVEYLLDYLDDWIQQNDWAGEFHFVKRSGHIFDSKAREIRVKVR